MTNFTYEKSEREYVSCNYCGADTFRVLAARSANGLNVRTCLCKRCGLIYLNPRMTAAEYSRYYADCYRDDRSRAKGTDELNLEENFERARKFGNVLAVRLSPFFKPGLTIDVGSSTGGILYGLREKIPQIQVFGIEPSLQESEFANSKGIKTETSLFENFNGRVFSGVSTILCVQSLNHLLNPRKFFEWAWDTLEEGGHCVLAVKNFRHQCRRSGGVSAGVQIDHPYMFTPETLKAFTESVGFTTVYSDVDEYKSDEELFRQKKEGMHRHHIRLVGEKRGVNRRGTVPAATEHHYKKLRWQLSQPMLFTRYLFRYSRHFKFLRAWIRK